MSDESLQSTKEFASTFRGFLQTVAAHAPVEEPIFVQRLREHFDADPTSLSIVSEHFQTSDHPNVQVAIDEYIAMQGRLKELIGINTESLFGKLRMAQLLSKPKAGFDRQSAPEQGPVEFVNVELADNNRLTCVQRGLYLIRGETERMAVLVNRPAEDRFNEGMSIEVMTRVREEATRFLGDLRTCMRRHNVYRGHVMSLSTSGWRENVEMRFHTLPKIERTQIILPEGVLERIERQTLRFSAHSEKLAAAGRHLKRGILFHGPPGSGKTLTAMYLVGQMHDRTVFLITGRSTGAIQQACTMARLLQPSIIILEDVDLIAEDRSSRSHGSASPLLLDLLNEMDGLAEDSNVLFLLTTNRPEVLEPALAGRPGRVDQAFELPLPDGECRRRLFDLYSHGMSVQVSRMNDIVARTEGVSAAFIRELLRRAALIAADDPGVLTVTDNHIDAAIHELMVEGGAITRSLLGFRT